MKETLTPELGEIMQASHYRPAISIILPFEPKMGLKNELSYSLKLVMDKVARELKVNYPVDTVQLMMEKLSVLVKNLNFNTLKKSIAIYLSPVFEKVLYLDIPVEEKIVVDESFEIRDLVMSKKELTRYLVLLLSANESRMFLGSGAEMARILSDSPESIHAYINDAPERVSNFSDPSSRKEILQDKFLKHIDNSLGQVLNAYHLPVFILGPSRILGHFKKLSSHKNFILDFIKGNFEETTIPELRKIMSPYIQDWKRVKEMDILNKLEKAASDKKLSVGIHEAWKYATHLNGRLLVVEKNFRYEADREGNGDDIRAAGVTFNKFSFIKDAVDDIIEKVLENGGDVEFMENGMLKDFERIALIRYY
jgi:hypothetical protein